MDGAGEVHPLRVVRCDAGSRGRVDRGRDHGKGPNENEVEKTTAEVKKPGEDLICCFYCKLLAPIRSGQTNDNDEEMLWKGPWDVGRGRGVALFCVMA
jgi:hypothetical protein